MVLFSINELTLHSNFTLWFALSYNHLKIRLNFVYYAKNDIAEIDILKRYQRTVLYKLDIAYISTSQYFKTIYIKSYINYTKQEHKYT